MTNIEARSRPRIVLKVISLTTSIERRRFVSENLSGLSGIPWSFFDAFRSDTPSTFEYSADEARKRLGRELGPSEIGCSKSHLAVIETFLREGDADWLFVIEDDVWVDVSFDFLALVDFLESRKLNHTRLYARWMKPYDLIAFWGERQLIRYRTEPYGLQGYLINRAAAARFLKTVTHVSTTVDVEMGAFYINGLELYAVFPFPIIERAVPSTLQAGRVAAGRAKEKSSFAHLIYRIRHRLLKARSNLVFRATHKTMRL